LPVTDSSVFSGACPWRSVRGALCLRRIDAQKGAETGTRVLGVAEENLAFSRFDEDFFALRDREGRPLQFLERQGGIAILQGRNGSPYQPVFENADAANGSFI